MLIKLYEIFDEFEAYPDHDYQVDLLRRNDSWSLREVLKGTFDPNIEFTIKEPPPYKPSDAPPGMGYTTIVQELDRAYLFQKNNPRVSPNLTEKRKNEILIQILESLEGREAEVYMNMILKDLKVKGLTEEFVRETFPGLLSERKEENK